MELDKQLLLEYYQALTMPAKDRNWNEHQIPPLQNVSLYEIIKSLLGLALDEGLVNAFIKYVFKPDSILEKEEHTTMADLNAVTFNSFKSFLNPILDVVYLTSEGKKGKTYLPLEFNIFLPTDTDTEKKDATEPLAFCECVIHIDAFEPMKEQLNEKMFKHFVSYNIIRQILTTCLKRMLERYTILPFDSTFGNQVELFVEQLMQEHNVYIQNKT